MERDPRENRLALLGWWLLFVAVAIFVWKFVPAYVFKYMFFLRIPLLMGILLFALPLVATSFFASILKNLFVLERKLQIASIILGATVAGIAVSVVLDVMLNGAPARFELPALPIPLLGYYVLVVILVSPTILTLTRLSKKEISQTGENGTREVGLGVSWGLIFDALFLFVFSRVSHWISDSEFQHFFLSKIVSSVELSLGKLVSFLSKNPEAPGYLYPNTKILTDANLNALIFLLVLFLVYIFIFFRFKPKAISVQGRRESPAIFFVMLLISIATLFLGNLTFFFDALRIPTLLFILVLTVLTYYFFQVDHFFTLHPDDEQPSKPTDFYELLQTRLTHQNCDEKTVVLVCASGGGIQAAGWTTRVLMGLQEVLGESFTQAIGLISAVSGGSVGTIYYLDQFTRQGCPPTDKTKDIFNRATTNSLDAVGWGLTYPDLWRIISLPFLPDFFTPDIYDRGIALEKNWQGEMQNPASPKTLADWRKDVEKGILPVPVLNATSVEDGCRLLLSPVSFPSSQNASFTCLYPEKTINVVTAARLSATFPYVSPICRDKDNMQQRHFADGGYFDNSGFVTGLEWLLDILSAPQQQNSDNENCKIKRILVLQINPFPKENVNGDENKDKISQNEVSQDRAEQPKEVDRRGLFMATLGPLLALFKVRDRILSIRNSTEVELLNPRPWQKVSQVCNEQGVRIEYFPIYFPNLKEVEKVYREGFYSGGEYDPPLSWKLTPTQKKAINKGWETLKNDPDSTISKIKQLWSEWTMIP